MTMTRRRLLSAFSLACVAIPAGMYAIPKMLNAQASDLVDEADRNYLNPLSAAELSLVAVMAEHIIPATDTVGAIGARVPEFISMMFSDWMYPSEQEKFRAGLISYQQEAMKLHGLGFLECSAAQQEEMLIRWDRAAMAVASRHGDNPPPFANFKALTVVGYYTSDVGQNEELKAEMGAGQYTPHGPVMMSVPLKV